MDPVKTRSLTRGQIGEFISSERGVRAFEAVQNDIQNQGDALTSATFLVLSGSADLGTERIITPATGQLTGTDAGAGLAYTLGLANTAVTAGAYGSASKTISATVDAKGRVTAMAEYALSTSNITEGSNLYFTNARARSALSGSAGVSYNSSTGAFTLDTASARNTDHTAVSITAGTGLSGGGDISANRTLNLANTAVTPGTYAPPVSITVDAQGRITAIS